MDFLNSIFYISMFYKPKNKLLFLLKLASSEAALQGPIFTHDLNTHF